MDVDRITSKISCPVLGVCMYVFQPHLGTHIIFLILENLAGSNDRFSKWQPTTTKSCNVGVCRGCAMTGGGSDHSALNV